MAGGCEQRNKGSALERIKASHLPPLDAWRVDPEKLQRFYAPTDDRGFVLPDETVATILELFEDDYEWPIKAEEPTMRPDIHHFQWYARLYGSENFQGRTIPWRFRELPSRKGLIPRQFHNVLHEITLPPAMPKYRDMEQHVEAYALARRLFESAGRTMEVQALFRKHPEAFAANSVANEIIVAAFDRQFKGYRANIELLGATGLESLGYKDPKFGRRAPNEVRQRFGKVVTTRVVNYVPEFRVAA